MGLGGKEEMCDLCLPVALVHPFLVMEEVAVNCDSDGEGALADQGGHHGCFAGGVAAR